jgi:endoribonuclease Dicer
MDNENLEVLGDCFLKLVVSMSLYHRYPLAGAGFLTTEKKKQISNANLYRIAIQNNLQTYLNIKKIVFRGKDANWLPPGYEIDQGKVIIGERYTHHNAKRKAFSDMIEAFIGTFLISSNYRTTLKFMHWLDLDVIPFDEQGTQNSRNKSIIFVVLSKVI